MSGIVVSIPRSGFHLHERILARYLLASGEISEYTGRVACEEAAVSEVLARARATPGRLGIMVNSHLGNEVGSSDGGVFRQIVNELMKEPSALWFTKAHDSYPTIPVISDVNTIVLIRDPFHQCLSVFWATYVAPTLIGRATTSLSLSRDELPGDSEFKEFFKLGLPQYGMFFRKWICGSMPNRRIVPYESTLISPEISAESVINWLFPTVVVNQSLLREVCASVESEMSNVVNGSKLSTSGDVGVKLSPRAALLSHAYRSVLPECAAPLAEALSIGQSRSNETGFDLGSFYFDALMELPEQDSSVRLPKDVLIL